MAYILKNVYKKILFVFVFLLGFGITASQYFYYTGVTDNGYQQGCAEVLQARFNAEGVGVNGGRLQIMLDKTKLDYETSDDVTVLKNNLLNGISSPWPDWGSPTNPSWVETGDLVYDIIDAQRYNQNDLSAKTLDYGFLNIKFTPKYSGGVYTVDFGMDYNGSTNKTSLTMGGVQKINSTNQNSNRTGTINILKYPCLNDLNAPQIQNVIPGHANTYYVENNGLNIVLTDNQAGNSISSITPFVYTGGNNWVSNTWAIDNQYGIDIDSLVVNVNGYDDDGVLHNVNLNGTDFNKVINLKTWQYLDKNYTVTTGTNALFDFGVENAITLTVNVADRVTDPQANSTVYERTFNAPRNPIIDSLSPSDGVDFVQLSSLVAFNINDDWAGVDSGTVEVYLSGMNEAASGYNKHYVHGSPYLDFVLHNGSALGESGNYDVTITPDEPFEPNSVIKVTALGDDLKGNSVTRSWTFTTRPDCEELGCCGEISLQTGEVPFLYDYSNVLYVSGGLNPEFTWPANGYTGYIDCDNTDGALSLYSGHGDGSSLFISYEELNELYFSGQNVKAILTGTNSDTIILYRFGNFIIKVYPSNRYSPTYKGTYGKIFFYANGDNTTILYSGFLNTNTNGTGTYIEDIPSGNYDVVYKGQSHLASYLSGVAIVGGSGTVLDFTTGTNLYSTVTGEDIEDSGIYYQYQAAGDIKNVEGNYDGEVNIADLIVLIGSAGYINEDSVDQYNEYNLNGDGVLNNIDMSVIIDNWLKRGAYYDTNPIFDGFIW